MNAQAQSNYVSDLRHFLAARKGYWKSYFGDGEAELRLAANFVRKGSVALDVGGCIGTYAYHLARRAGSVYVFEPNPNMAQRIRRSAIRNAIVENVALSSSVGTGTLRVPKLSSGRVEKGMASLERHVVDESVAAETYEVPLRRIDDYGFKDVSFIKIDVEGHEEGVVAGAMETIGRCRPTLLIEIEERHNKGGLARLAALFDSIGYGGWFLDGGKLRPLAEFDLEKDQKYDRRVDEADARARSSGLVRYINNFFFIPR
jgi:FkbM family methyltransferase